jgi:hypothetical protein
MDGGTSCGYKPRLLAVGIASESFSSRARAILSIDLHISIWQAFGQGYKTGQ